MLTVGMDPVKCALFDRKPPRLRSLAGLTPLVFLAGCQVHKVEPSPAPPITIPESYLAVSPNIAAHFDGSQPWWFAYKDRGLDSLMQRALTQNFSQKAALQRIMKAQADYQSRFAEQVPTVSISGRASRIHISSSDDGGENSQETSSVRDYLLGPELSYEIDLWRRLNSLSNAEFLSYQATSADAENATLLLSGKIAEYTFRIRALRELHALLKQQEQTSRTLLELTELRFRVGKGSALDVYQQRQQLQATEAQVPQVQSQQEQAQNALAGLLGGAPGDLPTEALELPLPELPPFPEIASPKTLLNSRANLRALQKRVESADFRLASLITERLPALSLSFSYFFNAAAIADLFRTTIDTLAGSISEPVIDGGYRRARIRSQEATLNILRNEYADSFLSALQDVENALVAERYQRETCENLERQIRNAQATLDEARQRYLQGLSDYLQVVVAVQSLQMLERDAISAKGDLLLIRNRLYLALGGTWTEAFIEQGAS